MWREVALFIEATSKCCCVVGCFSPDFPKGKMKLYLTNTFQFYNALMILSFPPISFCVPAKWPLLRILIWMESACFLNLRACHPWKKITRCSADRCENVITPAVSGPMPTTATQLAAQTCWNTLQHTYKQNDTELHRGRILIRCYADNSYHLQ